MTLTNHSADSKSAAAPDGIQTDRRTLIAGGAAALTGASALPALGASQTPARVDFSDPEQHLNAVIKIRASLDERLCMGFIKGRYYGVVDSTLTPLYNVLAGTISQYRRRNDGNYDARSLEVAFFTDWDTNELLETFDNPYTGKRVEVPQTRLGPSHTILSREERRLPEGGNELPGAEVSNRFLPPRVVHDDVYIVEEIRVTMPAGPGSAPFHYNEISTFQARMEELVDPEVKSANTQVHFNSIVSWRPWLNMAGHPGHLLGNGTGRRVFSADGLPPDYVALVRIHHPDFLDQPSALLKEAG